MKTLISISNLLRLPGNSTMLLTLQGQGRQSESMKRPLSKVWTAQAIADKHLCTKGSHRLTQERGWLSSPIITIRRLNSVHLKISQRRKETKHIRPKRRQLTKKQADPCEPLTVPAEVLVWNKGVSQRAQHPLNKCTVTLPWQQTYSSTT